MFLFVLLVVIIAFAHAFFALSMGSENHGDFINGNIVMGIIYSYKMSIGDFDTDPFEDSI